MEEQRWGIKENREEEFIKNRCDVFFFLSITWRGSQIYSKEFDLVAESGFQNLIIAIIYYWCQISAIVEVLYVCVAHKQPFMYI